METRSLEQVAEQVRALSNADRWRLRSYLEAMLAPLTEDELEQELVREGVLEPVPQPITDFIPYKDRQLIEVQGTPTSEILIAERR